MNEGLLCDYKNSPDTKRGYLKNSISNNWGDAWRRTLNSIRDREIRRPRGSGRDTIRGINPRTMAVDKLSRFTMK